MISALYRYPKKERRAVAALWGRRSAAAHQALRDRKGVDADTARMRLRHDARGHVIRHGATYRASGATHWQVTRSVAGRVDQFDFVANGRVKLTAGPRKFPRHFRP